MLYNALPVTIKTAPSLAVFKKRLKTVISYKSIHGIDGYMLDDLDL